MQISWITETWNFARLYWWESCPDAQSGGSRVPRRQGARCPQRKRGDLHQAGANPQYAPRSASTRIHRCLQHPATCPATELAEIHQAISANLHGKEIGEVFASIDQTPLASASVAQVHTATLVTGEEVVLKIRRPVSVGRSTRSRYRRSHGDAAGAQYRLGQRHGARTSAGFAMALREELDLSVEARAICA